MRQRISHIHSPLHIHMHTHCLLIPSHERNARAKKAKNEPRRKSEDRSGKDRSDAAKRKALPKAERHRTAKRGVMLQSVERRRRGEAKRSGNKVSERAAARRKGSGSNERKRASNPASIKTGCGSALRAASQRRKRPSDEERRAATKRQRRQEAKSAARRDSRGAAPRESGAALPEKWPAASNDSQQQEVRRGARGRARS